MKTLYIFKEEETNINKEKSQAREEETEAIKAFVEPELKTPAEAKFPPAETSKAKNEVLISDRVVKIDFYIAMSQMQIENHSKKKVLHIKFCHFPLYL